MSEKALVSPPQDGITSVRYSPFSSNDSLLVSSWDSTLRLYDAGSNTLTNCFEHKSPVLDCAFYKDDYVVAAGLDGTLVKDSLSGDQTLIGNHDKGIKCVLYDDNKDVLITGGWDCYVKGWDARAEKAETFSVHHKDCKVYTMDRTGNRIVVGTSGRAVHIYDIRNMSRPEQTRESSLMNQTRCIRCMPNGDGFVVSSIDGRIAVELFDLAPSVQANKYAFKCHRIKDKETNVQTLYPVNALAFHPKYGTMASGGCDGVINIWDQANRKRIHQFQAYDTSIASLAFNQSGTVLAIAVSYTYEQGDKESKPDKVILKTVTNNQVAPRKRTRQ